MFKKKEDKVEEEILSIVEEGHEQGFIHENEAEMISNILDFDDKKVRDIMTSRNKIFAVEKSTRIGECLENCLQSGFSASPPFSRPPSFNSFYFPLPFFDISLYNDYIDSI